MLKTVAMQVGGGGGGNGSGTVTQINTGAGLTGGPITTTGTVALLASGVTAGQYGSANQVPQFTVNAYGEITAAANVTLTAASIGAAPNTVNVLPGTGLTGGGPLTANVTLMLGSTAVTPGNYGNGKTAVTLGINQQGQITSAVNVAIPQITLGNSTVLPGGTLTTINGLTMTNVSVTSITNATSGSANGTANMAVGPIGYLTFLINGASAKVPYYNP